MGMAKPTPLHIPNERIKQDAEKREEILRLLLNNNGPTRSSHILKEVGDSNLTRRIIGEMTTKGIIKLVTKPIIGYEVVR